MDGVAKKPAKGSCFKCLQDSPVVEEIEEFAQKTMQTVFNGVFANLDAEANKLGFDIPDSFRDGITKLAIEHKFFPAPAAPAAQ